MRKKRFHLLLAVVCLLLASSRSRAGNSFEECNRYFAYLEKTVKIGEQIMVRSISGNEYSGKYRGEMGEYIVLQDDAGKVFYLRVSRLDPSIIPADFQPEPRVAAAAAPANSPQAQETLIAGLTGDAAKDRARHFLQELPAKKASRSENGFGLIPRLAVIRTIGAESLAVLNDPVLDPVCIAGCKRFGPALSPFRIQWNAHARFQKRSRKHFNSAMVEFFTLFDDSAIFE